jgi:hypothetical protein
LGRALAEKAVENAVVYWPDFTYAAENAGVLAAKTRDTRLFAGLGAGESDQLFAVEGLANMLAILRMGYGQGRDIDGPVRAERLPKVHAASLDKLGAANARLVKAAAACLTEIGDDSDATALVDAAMRQPAAEAQRFVVVSAVRCRPFPRESLRKLGEQAVLAGSGAQRAQRNPAYRGSRSAYDGRVRWRRVTPE